MSEELLVRHCSPTLAGIKTANLFCCRYESEDKLRRQISRFNLRLAPKGLRILPLKFDRGRALIYVYRPKKLGDDISKSDAAEILDKFGYTCRHPEGCIARLIGRLHDSGDFPHEIGLFLGYPPEDVRGFIENRAAESKCVGHWKVYGDEEAAKKLFAKYDKCTDVYLRHHAGGRQLEKLTVSV